MNELKKQKIEKFLNDEVMSKVVYDVLVESFMKPHSMSDVNLLAASRLSINLLQDSWKELSKYKREENSSSPPIKQVGL